MKDMELELAVVHVEEGDVRAGGGLPEAAWWAAAGARAGTPLSAVVALEGRFEKLGALPPSVAFRVFGLSLEGNRLRDLEGLVPVLQKLNAWGNHFVAIPPSHVFAGMPALVALDLSFNDLTLHSG